MFGISLPWLLVVILAGVLAGQAYFRVDTKMEQRRRAAIQIAQVLSNLGLVETPKLLISFAVEDISGICEQLSKLADLLTSHPDIVVKEFEAVYERVLDRKLADKEGRALIQAKLENVLKSVSSKVAPLQPVT